MGRERERKRSRLASADEWALENRVGATRDGRYVVEESHFVQHSKTGMLEDLRTYRVVRVGSFSGGAWCVGGNDIEVVRVDSTTGHEIEAAGGDEEGGGGEDVDGEDVSWEGGGGEGEESGAPELGWFTLLDCFENAERVAVPAAKKPTFFARQRAQSYRRCRGHGARCVRERCMTLCVPRASSTPNNVSAGGSSGTTGDGIALPQCMPSVFWQSQMLRENGCSPTRCAACSAVPKSQSS